MPGFEVYNNAGSLVINSDQRHTVVESVQNPGYTPGQDFDLATPFGNLNQLQSFDNFNPYLQGKICWVRFRSVGAWGIPGAKYFVPNSVDVLFTTYNYQPVSGYLDVFDGGGNLIWSAISAANMPRILGFIDISPGFDLVNNTYNFNIGLNPWIPINSCPGGITASEYANGYSSLLVQATGSGFNLRWIQKNQQSFQNIFNGRGNLRIPVAYFLGR